jgi:diacylglycerol O-acyltransferase / wax synthase
MGAIQTRPIVERFSGVDRAWLNMERPTNPMTILALIVFAAPVALDRLRSAVQERLLAFERFRCMPVADAAGARWERPGELEIEDHVIAAALPARGGKAELEALVGELAGAPLNPARPLWSFHLVERYGTGSALIVRIHHAYGDGVALVQVLLGLADPAPHLTSRGELRSPGASRPQAAPGALAARSSATPPPQAGAVLPAWMSDALSASADLIETGLHYLLHPQEAAVAAREAVGFGAELAHVATLTDDPPTCFKRPLSGVHRVSWADALLLEEVKAIGRVLGCSVNDVLVSILAGAIGRFLEKEGRVPPELAIRALVPINLRSQTDAALTNRFGLLFVDLPIGVRHPLERLYRVHAAMQALKSSSQPLVTLGLLWAFGSLPKSAQDLAVDLFSAKASLVASNLPGPVEPLAICGARIAEMLFWVPQSGSLGVGVSMLSYAGRVQLGVMADRNLIARPAELVALIAGEFERLVYLVLLGGAALRD